MFTIYSSRGAAIVFRPEVPASEPEPPAPPGAISAGGVIGVLQSGEVVCVFPSEQFALRANGEIVAIVWASSNVGSVGITKGGAIVAIV